MTSPAAETSREHVWTAVLAHRDRAVRVARARCANPADVEDCVQESLARVVAMPNVDLDRVGPLLSVIAANVAHDTYRRSDRGRRLQDKVTGAHLESSPPDDEVCDAAEARWLRDQLAQLRERDRAVLALRAEGYSLPETAAALGITYKAAESAYTRARNSMKSLWKVTLGAVGVLLGSRVHKNLAVGTTTVAAACVVALTGAAAQQAASAAGRPVTTPMTVRAHTTSAPASTGAAISSRLRAPGANALAKPRSGRSSASAARLAAAPAVTNPVVAQGSITVTREHGDESFAQTVVRCVRDGVAIDVSHVGCR